MLDIVVSRVTYVRTPILHNINIEPKFYKFCQKDLMIHVTESYAVQLYKHCNLFQTFLSSLVEWRQV